MSATIHTLDGRKPRHLTRAMQEACYNLAACNLVLHSYEPGSIAASVAEGARDWWFAEVQRLNPGGATIYRFPLPAISRKRRQA